MIVSLFLSGVLHAQANPTPDVYEVQKAALDYARIRPDELSDLKRRARKAALLPQFQVGAKRTFQDNLNISMSDNVSVTSSGVNIGPTSSDLKQISNHNTDIEVKAVWALNELIFSRDMLDIAQEARYQIRERRQILAEVNRLYFEWQKIKKNDELGHGDLRLSEVVADLDALTGGWFSNHIR